MSTTSYTITRWKAHHRSDATLDLINEEPLSIRIQGKPYAVVLRTPGDDLAHTAGFCLAEGLVDQPGDIVQLAACDGPDTNVVTVTLTPERQRCVAAHLDRRGYISQTGCGLCGKTLIDELFQALTPLDDPIAIRPADARWHLDHLDQLQPLRRASRAAHAAALLDADLRPLAVAEDVGRHNALDKVVGRLFLDGRLDQAKVVVLSSRISYELVQKSARARIPIVLALSRPTRLAVELAARLNITLAGPAKPEGMLFYCHPERFAD
ncbi:formate dehydrogenase accessory sulfurtransferase FdhD [Desulfatitalea alkaliphila]|uniref:Sulfur carrier protein FdhD n=1 Tax=Desulfatitalea alkaliphila TaxID=2929485 RepID=A0AA41R4S4_9BACT|nr:formate dehydrogenase accessory sulfurtransferase FdhD [Desulfatitalea alkaliphila]MCJ8500930.1 formate dehydrogenase accessory sulfurtransferase FdhD [Desulfatitalea alkaliphila]